MNKLIITADDFGMCGSVNDAIITCVESGVVRSTNVMVNMEKANEAAMLRTKYKDLSIGLHFNLTVGKPILPEDKVSTLIDESGTFHSYTEFRKRYHKNLIDNQQIMNEMKAQYKRFTEICGIPDYWNTHENVHVAFSLYQIITSTAWDMKISKMRSHERVYVPASIKSDMSLKWYLLNPIKTAVINRWQDQSRKKGIKSPDGLIVCLYEDDRFDFDRLCKETLWGKKHIAELTIHPATKNDSEYFGNITEKRIREFGYFSNPELISTAKKNGVSICGFEEVT